MAAQRIAIVGNAGAGKSTLAVALGARLHLPVHHLDAMFWLPGWVERSRDEFDALQRAAAEGDRWVIDGNYGRTYGLRFARADTILWLDLPRLRCVRGVLGRTLRYRGVTRPDVGAECPEQTPTLAFLYYVWNFARDTQPKLERALAQHGQHATLVRLRSDAETQAFLARL
jgi:adenylate kinase family enzyme